jgi:hypothetical protein
LECECQVSRDMKRDSRSIFGTFELGRLNKITKYLAIIVHGNRAKIPNGYF